MKNSDPAGAEDIKKSKRKITPKRRGSAGLPPPPSLPIPKGRRSQHDTGKRASGGQGMGSSSASGMPKANVTATSQADYDRLKPKRPRSPVGANHGSPH